MARAERLRALLCLPLAVALACAEETTPDPCAGGACADAAVAPDAAPTPDAGPPPDAGFPDAGAAPDAGTVFNGSSCLPCDVDCPSLGGLCVTAAGGEQFCADRCDADLDGCLAGYACVNIAPAGEAELRVCVPPGGSCRGEGRNFGTPCRDGIATCHPDRFACQGDALGQIGYCTDGCRGRCPDGFRCAEGSGASDVCLAEYAPEAERCAQEARPDELGCVLDLDCPPERGRCLGARPGLPGVCVGPCDPDGLCPSGQTCHPDGRGARVCVPERCACRAPGAPEGTPDLLGEALADVGLDRCSATWGVHDWASAPPDLRTDPYRLSWFDRVHNEPLRAPAWADGLVAGLEAATPSGRGPAAQAAEAVVALAARLDRPAVRLPAVALPPVDPLLEATAAFVVAAGGQPDRAAIAAETAGLSPELQRAAAIVVDGARRALLARRAAFAGSNAATIQALFDFGPAFVIARTDGRGLDPANAGVRTLLNEGIGYEALYGGAADLLDAIDASGLAALAVPTPAGTATVATATASFVFRVDTPVGVLAIDDGQSGVYDPRRPGFERPFALLIDRGGHDTYRIAAGANTSAGHPVAALVDLDGLDRYDYVAVPHPLDGARLPSDAGGRYTPRADPNETSGPISLSDAARQGAGRAGIGVLVDLGGDDDRYRSLRLSQGAAVFGAGILVDDGGDDDYAAEALAQGAAAFGIGLLLDLGGRDLRTAYQMAQAFAFARAAGALLDLDGDDVYHLDVGDPEHGGDPIYANAQRQGGANSSLGQGFAFGRRADFSDRAFMSGGLAVLYDRAGDDEYEASIFAQGGGFWFGTGLLVDRAGDDRYDSMWYGMGTGAHYALGLLLEGGGNDRYGGRLPRINVTMGGGHDFSAAFLIDESGDDVYLGGRITLGSGNVNGFGVFVDNGGDDRYSSVSPYAIGAAGLLEAGTREPGAARRRIDTVGLFLDAGGRDLYDLNDMPTEDLGDGRRWSRPQTPEDDPSRRASERARGIDADAGETSLHFRR